jgi:hypothetical protein
MGKLEQQKLHEAKVLLPKIRADLQFDKIKVRAISSGQLWVFTYEGTKLLCYAPEHARAIYPGDIEQFRCKSPLIAKRLATRAKAKLRAELTDRSL